MLNKIIRFIKADFTKQIPYGYQIKNVSALEYDKSVIVYFVLIQVFLLLFCFLDLKILLLPFLLSVNIYVLRMFRLQEEKFFNRLIYVFLANIGMFLTFYSNTRTDIPLNEYAVIALIAFIVALLVEEVVLRKDIERKILESKIIANNEIQARKENYAHYLGETATCIEVDMCTPSRITIEYRELKIPAYSTDGTINCNDSVEISNIEHVIEKARYGDVLVTKFYVKKI